MNAHTPATLASILRGLRFRYATEEQLQHAIAEALTTYGLPGVREALVGPRERVDLLVERVAIEVKLHGSRREVQAQVERYLRSDQVDGLVLVTARVRHLAIAGVRHGKPVEVVTLAGAGL